jgi:hypothetical protein
MGRQRRCPVEFRERAVRLVYEWRDARDRFDGGLKGWGTAWGASGDGAELGPPSRDRRRWPARVEL